MSSKKNTKASSTSSSSSHKTTKTLLSSSSCSFFAYFKTKTKGIEMTGHSRRNHPGFLSWWWLWSSTVLFVLLVTAEEQRHNQHQAGGRSKIVSPSVDSYDGETINDNGVGRIFLRNHGDTTRLLQKQNGKEKKQKSTCGDHQDHGKPANNNKCDCTSLDIESMIEGDEDWQRKHEKMVQTAQNAAGRGDLDVVLLGDSITAGWNKDKVFQRYFNQTVGNSNNNNNKATSLSSSLQGLALGVGGDTSMHLLWHLQHGLLDESLLQPKVWLVLIGTNDLGRRGTACSKRSTRDNIIKVATYLQERRPNTPIILHGILPRGHRKQNYSLHSQYTDQIDWINQELQRYCEDSQQDDDDNFYYLDASDIFLKKVTSTTTTTETEFIINSKLMKDALHPTTKGYQKWAPRIVNQVQRLIVADGGGP
jgi:lysophospholipase L1-like esterase